MATNETPRSSSGTDPAELTALAARERLASGSLRAIELTDASMNVNGGTSLTMNAEMIDLN